VHNEELHKMFSSPHIIRMNKRNIWAGHVDRMVAVRNVGLYTILIDESEGNLDVDE
jgi:hypothetical protein